VSVCKDLLIACSLRRHATPLLLWGNLPRQSRLSIEGILRPVSPLLNFIIKVPSSKIYRDHLQGGLDASPLSVIDVCGVLFGEASGLQRPPPQSRWELLIQTFHFSMLSVLSSCR
jgi:hypothetical protein